MKRCPRCREMKALADFHRPSGKVSAYCRPCLRDYIREWRRRHPDKVNEQKRRHYSRYRERYRQKDRRLRREQPDRFRKYAETQKEKRRNGMESYYKYGLRPEEKAALAERQGQKCGLCSRSFTERPATVDHCHKSGKIRGLLCRGCNSRLAWFENHREVVETYLNQ